MSTFQPVPGTPIDNSVRWLMGEDVTGGALRDMWNPTCYANPGKVTDPQYFCATADNGGVHFNSGVPNHAFALFVDGGVYNGQTVTSIGMVKALHLYYRAQTVYQSAASDFADHADAMEASCDDLVDGGDVARPIRGAARRRRCRRPIAPKSPTPCSRSRCAPSRPPATSSRC